jgi:crotonobetaine/carnitine-CoA ligase
MLPSTEPPSPEAGTSEPSDADCCLVCLLDQRAAQSGHDVYFRCDDEQISFAELRERSRQLAAALVTAGVHPGDVVATLAYNSVSHLVAVHACLRAGAVWAPLNVSLREADYAHACRILRPRLLLTTAELHAEHEFLQTSADSVELRLLPDESSAPSSAARLDVRPAAESPDHHWEPADLSWVIQSGATTGGPKSIALPHAFAAAQARRVIEAVDGRPDDVFFSVLQISHAWLNFGVLVPCLVLGATAASTRWFSASRWLSQVQATGATIVDPFLPMTGALLARRPSPDERTHRVRVAIGVYGAESEYERRVAFEDRFGIPTVNIYGLTETGGLVTHDRPGNRRPGSAGTVHPDYDVVIDSAEGWSTEAGLHGEILVRPRIPGTVALGYLGQAEKTLETWRDLWIHTGDLGHFDDAGHLYLSGRQAFWVRRKGENVSVSEVEEALLRLDGVVEAGVFGVPSPLGDQDIAAVLVPAPGSRPSTEDVQEELRSRIAFYKVPRFVRFVDDIPRTVKGDVDRRKLTDGFDAALYEESRTGAASSPAPGTTEG